MRSRIRIWIHISWIRIRIEVKSWIWIRVRIEVTRIRNLEYYTVDQMLWNVATANTRYTAAPRKPRFTNFNVEKQGNLSRLRSCLGRKI
jgi:hypothetical protein